MHRFCYYFVMKTKRYAALQGAKKTSVESRIESILESDVGIVFAYIHGSFPREENFSDIDVAVYLADMPASPLDYELAMETVLTKAVAPYPVDVRILNGAPLSFKYQVIKGGTVLVAKDDEKRAGFQEATLAEYFDFAPYRAMYLKETLGFGV